MSKTLIVVRHAHRDKKPDPDRDNGLSPKGEAQAAFFLRWFIRCFPTGAPEIFSSPKKRCIETVEPLAKRKKARVSVSPLLDEGGNVEKRSREFLREWEKSRKELTVICSHGDWIPAFLKEMAGVEIHLQKGGWIRVDREKDGFRLTAPDARPEPFDLREQDSVP